MDATEIVGNGFSGALTFACPLGGCRSRSQIGGAFFGADATEISGLILIDETVTRPVDLETIQTVVTTGAAGYSAEYFD